jgi:hypothetical protein
MKSQPAQVHYHPDGSINVRTERGNYSDTLANLRVDSRINVPALPKELTEQLYVVGVRHALIDGPDVVGGGPMPWDIGDALIAKIDELLSKKKVRDDAIAAANERKRLAEIERLKRTSS